MVLRTDAAESEEATGGPVFCTFHKILLVITDRGKPREKDMQHAWEGSEILTVFK
jgi:hypothetical protein